MTRVYRSPSSGSSKADATEPEALTRVLLLKSPLLIYIADLDFKIVLMSQALRELTGYDTSDCPTVPAMLDRFYPNPDYRKVVDGIHQGFVRNEHIRETELVVTVKDGTQRTISWSTSRLRQGGRGPTVGYVAFGVDVTTRHNLQQWVTLFQRSMEHLSEGVVLTDPAGHVLAWSAGATELLGHTDQDMQGKALSQLFNASERKMIARTVDRAVEGEGRYRGELELQHSGGHNRILVLEQHRLDADGGVPLARLTLLSEVTEDLSEQLSATQHELETLRGQLTSEAETAADPEELAAANKRADDAEAALAAAKAEADEASSKAAELAKLAEELESAKARVTELESAAADGESGAQALTDELARLREDLAAKSTAADEAEAARSKLAEELEAAQAAATEAQEAAASKAADELEAAKTQAAEELAAAQKAAEEARSSGEAKAAELAEAATKLAALTADVEAAQAEARSLSAELEAARGDHAAAQAEADKLTELQAELEELRTEAAKVSEFEALRQQLEEAQRQHEEDAEKWIQDRSRLEDQHRAALAEAADKAKEERTQLEEQLSTDILAAEERSEAERVKLVERHEQERKEWEAATEIARAEAESTWRTEVDDLAKKLAGLTELQPYLAGVSELAFVVADASGRIVGWSEGASLLDGRPIDDALGGNLHKDAMALQGIDWKNLFGRIAVAGHLEQDVVVQSATGTMREARLHARMVKGPGGKLLGVTEVLVQPELGGDLDLHTEAAFGRLAAAAHAGLLAQARAGMELQRRSNAAVDDLMQVARPVADGAPRERVEAAARRVALGDLLPLAGSLTDQAETTWQLLRASLGDLQTLHERAASPDSSAPWLELVQRCLEAAELASGRETVVARRYVQSGLVHGRGDRIAPLLITLLGAAAAAPSAEVAAGVEDGTAWLEVTGATAPAEQRLLIAALVAAAAGTLDANDERLRLELPCEATIAPPDLDPDTSVADFVDLVAAEEELELEAGEVEIEAVEAEAEVEVEAVEAEVEVEAEAEVEVEAEADVEVEAVEADAEVEALEADAEVEAAEAEVEPTPDETETAAVEAAPEPAADAEPDTETSEAQDAAGADAPTEDLPKVSVDGSLDVDDLELDDLELDTSVDAEAAPRKGVVAEMGSDESGDPILMAGEDSVIAQFDQIMDGGLLEGPDAPGDANAEATVEAGGDDALPPIDELEAAFDEAAGVSPSVLAEMAEMDAYAATHGEVAAAAGPSRPDASPEVLQELAETDADGKMKDAVGVGGEPTGPVETPKAAPKKAAAKKAPAKKSTGKGRRKRRGKGRGKK